MAAELREATPDDDASATADFDLHGYVGIRLLDATSADVAKVERQLGPLRTPLQREPDITVRFVDRIDLPRPLTFSAWPETGFGGGSFYILRGKGGVPATAQIPFQDVGRTCHIVCERGMPAVPLLLAIVNFTALAKGLLPLHASAYVLDGVGVLVTGWAKGGKTEALLAAMQQGASYIGDEWVYLSRDGSMYGVPEPIRLWRWQLAQLPDFWERVPPRDRRRIRALELIARGVSALTTHGPRQGLAGSITRRAAPVLNRQVYAQVPPAALFGPERLALRGTVDRVLYVTSCDDPRTWAERVDVREVADRMVASLAEERQAFMAAYRQFRFACPGERSAVVEGAEQLERDLIHDVLHDRPAAWIRHPYPADITRLGVVATEATRSLAQEVLP